MFGDVLEKLRVQDLRAGIGMPGFGKGLHSNHEILGVGASTNQQILDATKGFYDENGDLVDTTAKDAARRQNRRNLSKH